MKALTIWQPWASLIMAGVKPYEFRRWLPPVGEIGVRLVIHAGARKVRPAEIAGLIHQLTVGEVGTGLDAARALPLLQDWHLNPGRLPLASGLGTARLGDPRPAADIHAGARDSDRIDHQVWGWPLTDIQPFPHPVPAKGLQGFWIWKGEAP